MTILGSVNHFIVRGAVWLLRWYRILFSTWLGQHCRFEPSCSIYAEKVLSQHGFIHGIRLTFCRLLRCHPWHPGGYDPPPP